MCSLLLQLTVTCIIKIWTWLIYTVHLWSYALFVLWHPKSTRCLLLHMKYVEVKNSFAADSLGTVRACWVMVFTVSFYIGVTSLDHSSMHPPICNAYPLTVTAGAGAQSACQMTCHLLPLYPYALTLSPYILVLFQIHVQVDIQTILQCVCSPVLLICCLWQMTCRLELPTQTKGEHKRRTQAEPGFEPGTILL